MCCGKMFMTSEIKNLIYASGSVLAEIFSWQSEEDHVTAANNRVCFHTLPTQVYLKCINEKLLFLLCAPSCYQ